MSSLPDYKKLECYYVTGKHEASISIGLYRCTGRHSDLSLSLRFYIKVFKSCENTIISHNNILLFRTICGICNSVIFLGLKGSRRVRIANIRT